MGWHRSPLAENAAIRVVPRIDRELVDRARPLSLWVFTDYTCLGFAGSCEEELRWVNRLTPVRHRAEIGLLVSISSGGLLPVVPMHASMLGSDLLPRATQRYQLRFGVNCLGIAVNGPFACGRHAMLLPAGATPKERVAGPSAPVAPPELSGAADRIGAGMFRGCAKLRRLKVCAGVIEIGGDYSHGGAFQKCESLLAVQLSSPLSTIGDGAFSECIRLFALHFPASLKTIGSRAFLGCWGLRTVRLPAGLTCIGSFAFGACRGLTAVEFASASCKWSGLTTISDSAFTGCTGIRQLRLPASLTTVGSFAFAACTSLRMITFPAALTAIGNYGFGGCVSLQTLHLPPALAQLGISAFGDCFSLTLVRIPASTVVGCGAFPSSCRIEIV